MRETVVLVCEEEEMSVPLYAVNSGVLPFLGCIPNDEKPIAAATMESSGLSSMLSEFVMHKQCTGIWVATVTVNGEKQYTKGKTVSEMFNCVRTVMSVKEVVS